MLSRTLFTSLLALAGTCLAAPSSKRQDDTKVGYFFTSFPVDDEAIYMHLSNGNNPHSYRRLSYDGTPATEAILRSNVGTQGVRDSYIIPSQDGSRFWMIATDLNVNFYNGDFNNATRFGSRAMVIWESTDLANWTGPRLTDNLVGPAAGNLWAPEAVWDPSLGAFVVVFASRFWNDADTDRMGPQPPNVLMYVTTTDFQTFSEAREYFNPGYPVIDTTFLHYPEEGRDVWYRWVKSEVDYMVFQQKSTNGVLGTWTNVGGAPDGTRIEFARQYVNNEGPLIFRDNVEAGRYHLWIDQSSTEQYIPATATTLDDMAAWQPVSLDGFPIRVKHGFVMPVNQQQYDAIEARYRVIE